MIQEGPSIFPERIHHSRATIADEPRNFKVCCGCEAILTIKVALCPACHAYRFEEGEEVVMHHAAMMGAGQASSSYSMVEDLV